MVFYNFKHHKSKAIPGHILGGGYRYTIALFKYIKALTMKLKQCGNIGNSGKIPVGKLSVEALDLLALLRGW